MARMSALLGLCLVVGAIALPMAQSSSSALRATEDTPEITFTKHIAPILQRSCENCHRPDGVAPMSLRTYDEVRPWARAIKQRTGIGPRAGVMPPWYVEKNIGIQKFKNDPSLSADEIAMIAKWADSGAPRGNPADMPPLRTWTDSTKWSIGEPDLVVRTTDIVVKGTRPTGGARFRACRRASPKIATCRRSRFAKSTTSDRRAPAARRSAAATCSTT